MPDVTQILSAIDAGDPRAADQLLPLVYDELRKLAAARKVNERPDQSLNATTLVHEAYLRSIGDQRFDNRGHFFAATAEAMRRILVDAARRKNCFVSMQLVIGERKQFARGVAVALFCGID
jgi:RNA polymerase sigma factor (TIGR02999 family)